MQKIRKAIIPAAGLGTRFLPATVSCPKEMLTVVDKPVIQYIVEEAAASGIEDILIITRPGKETITDHFNPSQDLISALTAKQKNEELAIVKKLASLARIHYINQDVQRGLADAIYYGREFTGDEPFAVLLGDTIIETKSGKSGLGELIAVYAETGKQAVLVQDLHDKQAVSRYGVIDPAGAAKRTGDGVSFFELNDLVEKPRPEEAPSTYAITCRYIFEPEIYKLIKKTKPGFGGELQITDSMRLLTEKGKMVAGILDGQTYDVGNKLDFIKVNVEMALKRPDMKEEITQFIKNISSKL